MEVFYHTLTNGIRLVHRPTASSIAHCGLLINTGSRDEPESAHGMVHLIEHMMFKGTRRRKAYHILSRMEDVGGEINAYTTKEETCIYQSFFPHYYDRALELIADIIFNSYFPEREMDKEKGVIIDEINSYRDSPAEMIYDDFEEMVFKGNPIGRNILGTEESLRSFVRPDIVSFYNTNYFTNEMVISSVGNIPFDRLVKLSDRYFGGVAPKPAPAKQAYCDRYIPFNHEIKKDTYQMHCVIGNQAYSANQEDRFTLYLLNNLLGGPGLNSRLNMSLREKKGYAYNVDASYTAYSDTGLINIYFGADLKDLKKSLRSVKEELDKIKEKPLSPIQLARAKRQLEGQIAISSDNNENLMLTMAKSVMLYNRVDSLEESLQRIRVISSQDLQLVAGYVFDSTKLSYLIYY